MSFLHWNPSPIKDGRELSKTLHEILIKKYGESNLQTCIVLTEKDYDYFAGLADAGVSDAELIRDKIRLHKRIELRQYEFKKL